MRLRTMLSLMAVVMSATMLWGQSLDTLSFYSQAFKGLRKVYVHTPTLYKYKADSVKLPVIYILDGQHEWFVNPILEDIKYLQYNHAIPNAIVVVIPHDDRNRECGIKNINEKKPLDEFITQEVDNQIQKYNPSQYKVIIGHSFSASFALYSFRNHPKYYSAVISHSPLDQFEELIKAIELNSDVEKSKIFISIGGKAPDKDPHHRKKYDELRSGYPRVFASINTYEADYSSHNSVPIVAGPYFFSKMFVPFTSRYSKIAIVDENFKLIDRPKSIDEELSEIKKASMLDSYFYPPEIPHFNGLASKYSSSGYSAYAIRIYQEAIKYYPYFFGFYLSLYELLKGNDPVNAKLYLQKAKQYLEIFDVPNFDKEPIRKKIETEMKKFE